MQFFVYFIDKIVVFMIKILSLHNVNMFKQITVFF